MSDNTQTTNIRLPGFDALEPRLLFCAGTAITANLASDLIAHWSFEQQGGSTIQDVSNQAADHRGSLASGASSTSSALCGNGSAHFVGGASEMTIANHNEINLVTQGQRSVSLWFNADNIEISSRRQVLYEEGATTRGLSIYLYNGELFAGGWNRVGSESDWDGTWFSTDRITSGGWHHVVLTLDGGSTLEPNALNAYLDGQLFGSGEGSQLWGHAGDITFGNGSDTRFADGSAAVGNQGFEGLIDEARLYNRALSAHDIAVLSGRFNEGAAITLARAAKFDLVAEADPIAELEPTQAQTVEEMTIKHKGIDVLTEARPIAFPTADDDKTATSDAGTDTAADTQVPDAPSPPADTPQADAQVEDHKQDDDQPEIAAVAQDEALATNDDADELPPSQSTAQVDEPKRRPVRRDEQKQSTRQQHREMKIIHR